MFHDLIPIVLFVTIGATIVGLPIARAFARRIDRQAGPPTLPPDAAARLERMEQAIDTIALEIERISEGQRFTTKLLAERIPERVKERVPERVAGGLPANDTNGHRAPAMRARSDHA
jgi:hypothetical protein